MICFKMIWKIYFTKVAGCNGTNSNQISNKKNRIHEKVSEYTKKEKENSAFYTTK